MLADIAPWLACFPLIESVFQHCRHQASIQHRRPVSKTKHNGKVLMIDSTFSGAEWTEHISESQTTFIRRTLCRSSLATSTHVFALLLPKTAEGNKGCLRQILRYLSPEETERAERLRHAVDRTRYVFGRGLLRCIAGAYMAHAPGSIEVMTTAHGKPMIAGASLSVNVSHSGRWVLAAAGEGTPMGVDVELRDPSVDIRGVAGTVFSDWENEALHACPEQVRMDLFYEIWTRKEAVIKADGRGIQFGLQRFDVEFRPGHTPCVRKIRHEKSGSGCSGDESGFDDPTILNLQPFALDAEYAACLCYAGAQRSVQVHFVSPASLFSGRRLLPLRRVRG